MIATRNRRTSRRQFVASAAGVAALVAAGRALPAPVEAAPPAPVVEQSAVMKHAEYLVSLIARWEHLRLAGNDFERRQAATILANADRSLDFLTDCLDGTMARRIYGDNAEA